MTDSGQSVAQATHNELVESYYDLATPYYLAGWGVSHHFAVFQGEEDLATAITATETTMADKAGFTRGMRLLDVGCGVGGPALTIAAHTGAHVTGVDISHHRVELANERAANPGAGTAEAEFLVADALDLPFPDDSFDGAFSFEAFCHMPDKQRAYAEVARVVRGVFTGFDWFHRDDVTQEEIERYIEPLCEHYALASLISCAEFTRELEVAGFSPEVINATELGDLEPNWQRIEQIRASVDASGMERTPAQEMLRAGGEATCDAARTGAAILGYWRA